MNTISIVADLELKHNDNMISIANVDENLVITVNAESAAIFPFSLLWANRKWIKKSRFISHPIRIVYNGQDLILIDHGKYKIVNVWLMIKLFFQAIF